MATAWQTILLFECLGARTTRVVDPDESARHGRRPLVVRWVHASRLGIRWVFVGLVGASALLAAPWSGWSAEKARPADDASGIASAPSAEVTFDTPRRFATIMEPSSKRQRLYGVGDVLPDPQGSGGGYRITQIEERRLQLGSLRGRKAVWIAVGGVIPGRRGRRVIGTPILRTVEYRYVRTGGPLDAEPRVVELREGYASLEVDTPLAVSPSPPTETATPATPRPASHTSEARRTFENTLLGRVRVTPTAKDAYEINADDLNAALEHSGQLLAEAWPRIWPDVSFRHGMSFDVQSPVANGTLGPRGFRVTSPNLAERAGVEVGDVIVGVNGQPVNSFLDVYRVYTQMQRDPSLSVIQLDVERHGQRVTNTYRIR